MSQFIYKKPKQLQEAFSIMKENPAYSIIAGGTDLMVKMKDNRITAKVIIDVSELNDLREIKEKQGTIYLGAAVTHTEICKSELLRGFAPALVHASGLVGSPQIRNRGTVGGNIGNASPAADTIPALMAYGAEIVLASAEGVRSLALEDFFVGPGRTVISPGEVILSIEFNKLQATQAVSFEKLGKRKALAISVVNAAAFLEIDKTKAVVTKARLALGSVAAKPIRVSAAEEALIGYSLSDDKIKEVAKIVSDSITPIDDVRSEALYRKRIAGVLTQRTLIDAWKQLV
ncbi:MAG: aerobic-type carbon monoxide dehydrogenase, middle subunit CoxM/CutM-like protein [Firmicutes bacterium]|nr:aerobic-type carbon monoxide dehydrogenase, middle subunit CoxM/CutM-like protein [Bacillota bacterium]